MPALAEHDDLTPAGESHPAGRVRRVLIPPHLPPSLTRGGGAPARPVWSLTGATMGTYWRARLVARSTAKADDPHAANTLLTHTFQRIVALMSPWEPDSDLGRFARATSGEWVPLAPETAFVLQRALAIAALTEGAYNPSLGVVTDLLGFGPTDPARRLPLNAPAVQSARGNADFRRLEFDSHRPAVRQPGGLKLDLCSIAKGYAVDLASDRLHTAGWTDHFIEIGGEARGRGSKPDGQPWWCQLESPATLPATVAALCATAIATSGNTHHRFDDPTGSVGHIIPPAGTPHSPDALHSVTVLASTCMEADAWATALYALGPSAGLPLATQHRLAVRWIHTDLSSATPFQETHTPEFAEWLQ